VTAARRTVLRAGLGLTALAAGAGVVDLAATGSARDGGLRIGYLPITDAAPLLLAHAQNRYARAGVRVDRPILFRAWESLAQAFLEGELDVVHLLMPFALQLRYALGARLKLIAWGHTNGSALTVAQGISSIEQLAGRKVAVPFWWSIHNVVIQEMLRAGGLTPVVRVAPSVSARTVQLLVMSPSDMLPALQTGTIAGYTVADPFNAAAELKQVGRISRFLGDVWCRHACCVIVVRQDLIDRNPAAVQAITTAIVGAQRWIDTHRVPAAGALAAGYLPEPKPAIARSLTYPASEYHLRNPQWQGQRIGFAPFPFPSYTERLVTAMQGTVVDGDRGFLTGLSPDSVHAEVVDDRFVRHAVAAAGGPAAFGLPASLTRQERVHP
jgi:NitT/TauT family transport system substrate-binding protein